ncbi:hypothetical protein DM860_006326 [Cuscuta australis]|uniref:RING-type E3 ubiquitin transferase n=1 Tax=Cuscuta australis TaxID=267555 RepID=A0A328DKA5_9ASTE|nr:hypothetical protein DM860_006326 [Cuscuta australis]
MSSYWCYRCTRFVRVFADNSAVCPYCDSGFIEAVESAPASPESTPRLPTWTDRSEDDRISSGGPGRSRRNRGDRYPFNPVIVLRNPSESGQDEGEDGVERSYELFYDDGEGSGLRPLPPTMSEFLMGSGFDRLLDQLAQIEVNGFGRPENPPASKSAIESMPTIQIAPAHINSDSHCAVCKDAFVLASEAREMPCKHIYHPDCILPWLSMRNSCPVCRHELPTDSTADDPASEQLNHSRSDEEAVGLTIWRLPGGGFAVGRFSGGRRGGERDLPVVYTEMDGGFNNGVPRRIAWRSRRRNRRRDNPNGIARVFNNFISIFRRSRSTSQSISMNTTSSQSSISESSSISRSRSVSSTSVFSRYLMRRNSRSLIQEEDQNGISRW